MEIAFATDIGDDAWDDFCEANDDAWFFHTTGWTRYLCAYRPELATEARAFVVHDGGQLVCVMPCMVERSNEAESNPPGSDPGAFFDLTAGGGPCWGPVLADALDQRDQVAVLRLVLDFLDEIARERGARRAVIRFSPLSRSVSRRLPLWLAEFTRAGWPDISLTSMVIDVTAGREAMWRGMRKGHRADVRRAQRQMTVVIDDEADNSAEHFATYRELHRKAAGRVTRPAETFHLMEGWIPEGRGVLLTALVDGKPVGCTYVYLYKGNAYYGSAANDPDASDLPVGHFLQWETMNWLVDHGFERYDIGIQQFGTLPYDHPSAKELAISHFKRGFGGQLVPLLTRERYVQDGAAAQSLRHRADRLSATLP